MACDISITGLTQLSYDCNLAFGGLKSITLTPNSLPSKSIVIEFNDKDAFTNYEEKKTATTDGISNVMQTLNVEHPRTKSIDDVMKIANPNMKFIIVMETKAGKFITMGSEFGASLKTSTVNSGASKNDKSTIQLVFSAEEANMSIITSAKPNMSSITNSDLKLKVLNNN